MFVRRRRDVKEMEFPADLKELGLFVNDDDEIRQIDKPTEKFEYKVFKNSRWNELRREAVYKCLRKLALDRLSDLGFRIHNLKSPNHHTSIPILHSSDLLHNRSRLLLLIPDETSDLGIWSTRAMDGEVPATVSRGSMAGIAAQAIDLGYSVLILNTGALKYDTELGTTLTEQAWKMRNEKPWSLGGRIKGWDKSWDEVRGSEDPEAHVGTVMRRVASREVLSRMVPNETEIYVVAQGEGARAFVMWLDSQGVWEEWGKRFAGAAFGEPRYWIEALKTEGVKNWLKERARAYVVAVDPRGARIKDPRFGCGAYSAMTDIAELVVPWCTDMILEYLEALRMDPEGVNAGVVFQKFDITGGKSGEEEAEGGEGQEGGAGVERVEAGEGGGRMWGDGSTVGCGW
ncbi:hypothetical protein BDZ91DRAFT_787585 [Kalaharituber pfeilii]|nr:hypothetical protein BDZ91DRAFT_787585 [Kalaharituber pfeilii]